MLRTITPSTERRFAWLIMGLLFAGSVVNYMDRSALGVVMPQVRRDLSLTNTQYGFALNAFLVMYMIFYILGGRLADVVGCRRMFSITVVVWSLAKMAHAFARGLGSLCLFRAWLGMGEGGFYPAAIRSIAEWFPSEQRAKGVGLLLCGLSVGALVTPPFVAWTASSWGWRGSLFATGCTGLLLIPPWHYLHRRILQVYGSPDPAPAMRRAESAAAATEKEAGLHDVLRSRKYWCILAARSLSDGAWYFYLFWMPAYFQDARGFDMRTVGMVLWIPYFAADVGALGGAWASSTLIQRGQGVDRGRKTVLLISAALATCGGASCFIPQAWLALAAISAALLGHQSWSTNLHTVVTEISPAKLVALLYGITGAAGTLVGALSQPVIGRMVDFYGYAPPIVCAGAAYAAAAALLLLGGRIERIAPPEREPAGVRTMA
jgi:MFS transporter, ACS family, hexuronate transporter